MKENLLCAISAKGFQPSKFSAEFKKPAFSLIRHCERPKEAWQSRQSAFSLVEMLMALLVASLLLAALAPVMTRRMADHELKVMSEASNYEKDSIVTIFTDSSETQEFNIPNDTNRITVTMMGGGGAGGNALYENREFTSSQEFTVPDGITKLRVFMVGAGGGGASGGVGAGTEYADIPPNEIGTSSKIYYVAGNGTSTNTYTFSPSILAPAVSRNCSTFGPNAWTCINGSGTVSPGAAIPSSCGYNFRFKTTACGGSGGGGYGSGSISGAGGYLANIEFQTAVTNLYITVGGGGGAGDLYPNQSFAGGYGAGGGGGAHWGTGVNYPGAKGGINGGNGGQGGGGTNGSGAVTSAGGAGGSSGSWPAGHGGSGGVWGGGGGGGGNGRNVGLGGDDTAGGGGGGGPTTISTSSNTSGTILFQVGGGGGAGGYVHETSNWTSGGGGGGGGGYGGGGGGGGASVSSRGTGGGGGSGTHTITQILGYGTGATGGSGGTGVKVYGGKGGNGYGGGGSTIFGSNYCDAVSGKTNGKPGALKLFYPAGNTGVTKGLKCEYFMPPNSGGGGGAGQIWIGELSVTPGEKLNFNIGIGGNRTTSYGANGNNGGSTSITNNNGTTLISVSGGKGGKYESDETYINNSYGIGGGIKTSNVDSSLAKYVNWKKTNFHTGGENGGVGKTPSNGAGGGKGGQLYDLNGTLLKGGIEGGAQSNGSDALITNYGTGGGGGGGVINDGGTPGLGGKGANGYIYVEWGGTNGGGGTVGEFTQKVLTNFDQTDRKIVINIGKGGDSSINNGIGGETSISVKSGGKNISYKARGGIRGNDGTSEEKVHGEEISYPDNYDELYKQYVQSNMSIIKGQKGEDDYGGMGGYLDCLYISKDEQGNKVCNQSIISNDGLNTQLGPIRPGCGGTSITAPLYNTICIPYSTSANPNGGNGILGAGGGGGAVLNQMKGKGGKGGDGFVILEYKSVQ